MTLRKTKVSIVINAIYVLLASALCIITIMDAAEGFGFSYFPGLIAFAALVVLGPILKKLLSYTAGSDKFKTITEKGDTLGLIVFFILLVFSVVFRVASYSWNGLGGTAYFEIAKVTGQGMGHYVHGCDDWYLRILHCVFFLFGNRIFIAAIFNCVLQMAAVILGTTAFRRMLGIVPALAFTAFWTITGFSVHEALTLNSRSLVFFLICLTLFVFSLCVPASSGRFFSYLFTGLLASVCIYADVAGLTLIPFMLGILFNDQGSDDDNSLGLRLSKMLFTLVSTVFGLVLLIFVDSYLSSANPFRTLSSIAALYRPSDAFFLGFSYMTSYAEILVMAVIVALGIFNAFFSENEPRLILLLSTLTILIINNFGMTYLENDGREIFFMFGALIAGISFRELFPTKVTGDVFKTSAEMYDNEFADPDKGYVPTGLKKDIDHSEPLDDLSDLDIKPDDPADPGQSTDVAKNADPEQSPESYSEQTREQASEQSPEPHSEQNLEQTQAKEDQGSMTQNEQKGFSPIEMFDAVILPRPGQSSQTEGNAQDAPAQTEGNAQDAPAQTEGNAQDAPAQTEGESAEPAVEEKKKSVYVPFGKPQLKPEYKRRPGAWMQALNEKNKLASDGKEIKLGAQVKDDASAEMSSADADSAGEKKESEKTPSQEQKAGSETEKKAPEIAANGAVLLDNPIPHPVRKTERKPMEYDINVTDAMMDYDIKISDNDDFDI
ncbi:MAG: hypothetical protein K6G43_10850 [Lachnospiraceae bacterium]|nr:hypothetical protein [Lachnospiraceae bacterium]